MVNLMDLVMSRGLKHGVHIWQCDQRKPQSPEISPLPSIPSSLVRRDSLGVLLLLAVGGLFCKS